MANLIHTIPRVPVALADAPAGDAYKHRGQGAAAVERSSGQAKLRIALAGGKHAITFDHGRRDAWRPPQANRQHEIQWEPSTGLRFRYESYRDHTKLTIYADDRWGQHQITYAGEVGAGLEYRPLQGGFAWGLFDGDRQIAVHPAPTAHANGLAIPAGLSIAQVGTSVLYTVTLDQAAAEAAWDAGHVVEIDPTTIDTSTQTVATAYSNQRKVDRCQDVDKTLWAAFDRDGRYIEFWYSKDNGATWTDSTNTIDMRPGGTGSYTPSFSIFIDLDDYLHVAFKGTGTGYVYYRRGTPNAGRTSWTFASATGFSAVIYGTTLDIVAHRDGTGWYAHVVYTRSDALVHHLPIQISSGGTITPGTSAQISLDYNTSMDLNPSIDFNHNGDGKTLSGSDAHLYVGWHAGGTGAGKGIRFKKATATGTNSWAWGTERELSTADYANAGRISGVFDGSRFLIAYAKSSSTSVIEVLERDAADTTTTSRTPTALSDGVVLGVSISYYSNGDIYLFAIGTTSADPKYIRYNRSGAAWDGSWTAIENVTAKADSISAQRGYGNDRIDALYVEGASSPYNVRHNAITFNTAPNAPTGLTRANYDAANAAAYTWTFSDPDGGDTQGSYQLQIDRVDTGANVVDTGKTASGTSSHTVAGGTLTNALQYRWRVKTWDAADAEGSWSDYVTFYASAAPTATITNPASDGATVTTDTLTAEHTYSDPESGAQSKFQYILTDNADAELWNSGEITGAGLSKTIGYTLANSTSYKVKLRVWDDKSVASAQVVRTFTTSFNAPRTPTIVVTNVDASGYITVAITNPAPRTNLLAANQSNVETDLTGLQAAGAGSSIARVTTTAWQGAASVEVTADGSVGGQGVSIVDRAAVSPSAAYTGSAYAKGAGTVQAVLDEYNGAGTYLRQTASANLTLDGTWQRINVSATVGADCATVQLTIRTATAQAVTFQVDGLQVEAGADASEWIVGGSTHPALDENYIYRRVSGDTAWTRIATGIAEDASYNDYNVASGVTYEYKARAVGDNGVTADSATGSDSITLTKLWLHDVADEAGTALGLTYVPAASADWQPELALLKTAGRTRPIAEFGENDDGRAVYAVVINSSSDMASLRTLAQSKAAVCARDKNGRRTFGVIPRLPEQDMPGLGQSVSLEIIETAYSEAV